jgi:hypothetical protein
MEAKIVKIPQTQTHADGQSKNILLFDNMRLLKNINIYHILVAENSLYVCTSHRHTMFYELEKIKSVFPVNLIRLQLVSLNWLSPIFCTKCFADLLQRYFLDFCKIYLRF